MKTSKKKHSFHNKHIYIYGSQTFWSFLKFCCTCCKELFCLQETVIMLIFLSICIKQSQHYEMRKNNSKLKFTKNCQASLFSHWRLIISKCSISLARLDEWSKGEATPLELILSSLLCASLDMETNSLTWLKLHTTALTTKHSVAPTFKKTGVSFRSKFL